MDFCSICKRIDEISILHEEDIAIIDHETSINYRNLKDLSDCFAEYLITQDYYQKGQRVLVYIERNVDMPAIFLGILKAGLAYIPLSNFHTVNKIKRISEDSGAEHFITDNYDLAKQLSESTGINSHIVNDIISSDADSVENFPVIQSNDLAYVLYTSGSTGKPKGVMIEHGQLAYYTKWFANQSWGTTNCLPMTSAVSFAAAVSQMYYSLLRGQPLHILPDAYLHQPRELLQWYAMHPTAAIYCVPTIWQELLFYVQNQQNEQWALPKTVLLSGEAVSENLKDASFEQVSELDLYNLYGPTEATANASFCKMSPNAPVRLGQAITGSRLTLLNQSRQRVSDGDVGEIYIIGPGVAKGYLNDSLRTNERFCYVGDGSNKQWAHATGDLGRIDSNGLLEFLGRKDRQLKLNGIRFDPTEIEMALLQHPHISSCIIDLHCGPSQSQILVAYLVTSSAISWFELRRYLQDRVSNSLIPGQFIFIRSLPKLPNGKIDKSRLPAPMNERPDLSNGYRAAKNPVEQKLIEIFQQVLGYAGLGADDSILELGGNSLQFMQLQRMIQEQFGCSIDYRFLFEAQTPGQLSVLIEHADKKIDQKGDSGGSLSAGLSHEQLYFLTLSLLSDETDYQIYFYQNIWGKIDREVFDKSLRAVLAGNSILRTRIDLDCDDYLGTPYAPCEIEFTHLNAERSKVEQLDWLRNQAQSVCCAVDEGPLVHFQLLKISDERHVLLVTAHHCVFDRHSIDVFSRQLIESYRTILAGDIYQHPSYLPYQEYVRWQNNFLTDEIREEALAFWSKQLLEDSQYLNQTDSEMFARENSAVQEFQYTAEQSFLLEKYAKMHQVTVPVILLTAFDFALKYVDHCCHAIGIPVSNRAQCASEDVVGCFVNMMSFMVGESQETDFSLLSQLVQSDFLKRLSYSYMSYSEIIDYYRKIHRCEPFSFQISFNYLNKLPRTLVNQVEFISHEIQPEKSRLDLSLTVEEFNDSLKLYFTYDRDKYSDDQIIELIDALDHKLKKELLSVN
ncbi:MAG: Linear gramicidin synthase subunit B [Candidatus Celerinatantimonas neptuna]|nr:MAG: Linear gramicidin synthase subunit B [Candidatus Celerinatantimonas neptuna]